MNEQMELLLEGKRAARNHCEKRFVSFHQTNSHVYSLFDKFTKQMIAAGRNFGGAKAVWERMRWFADFETTDAPLKLLNAHTAYYARLWLERNPDHSDFFELNAVQSLPEYLLTISPPSLPPNARIASSR